MSTGNDVLDNVSIQHYYGDKLCEGATLARKHRLYVTNWLMFKEHKKAMSTINPAKNKDKVISIAYLAGTPVACAFTDSRPLTQLFVRKALRRQGIGSKLFDEHGKWYTRVRQLCKIASRIVTQRCSARFSQYKTLVNIGGKWPQSIKW